MSARRAYSTIPSEHYAYVNEDQIDPELKCIICQQPFEKPMVGKKCGHTFCNVCISNWYKQNSSCPSCRVNTSFEPLTTRVVLSQLDRLRVHCLHCNRNNIERGDFNDHIQNRCHRVIVKCKAVDLKCSWAGYREEQAQHSAICPLLQIRPIVEELRAEIMAQGHQLQMFMNEVRDQLNYLQNQLIHPEQSHTRIINSVQDNMTEERRYQRTTKDMKRTWCFDRFCGGNFGRCNFCHGNQKRFFNCLVCSHGVVRDNVRAHDYSSPGYAVICKNCVDKYSKHKFR